MHEPPIRSEVSHSADPTDAPFSPGPDGFENAATFIRVGEVFHLLDYTGNGPPIATELGVMA
jgi:hypothetical protein